jgi:hypothetical protein
MPLGPGAGTAILFGTVGVNVPIPESSGVPELASTFLGREKIDEPSTANPETAVTAPRAITVQKERLRGLCAYFGFNVLGSFRMMCT